MAKEPPNAGSAKSVEEQRRNEKLRADQERNDIIKLMGTEFGRRIVWRILERGNVFSSTFAVGDPHLSAFNEGMRAMATDLLAKVHQWCPDNYLLMVKELGDGESA